MVKILKCPKCANEFKKPIFGRKKVGIGIGFTALGDFIKCPKCGNEASPKEFEQ